MLLADTDAAQAQRTAETIRAALQAAAWPHRQVTASIGVANADVGDGSFPNVLLARADRALYVAKQDGRNRVAVFDGWG